MTLTESSMSRMVDKIDNMEGTANSYRLVVVMGCSVTILSIQAGYR